MVSDDPEFETKAADILGLYLDPPKHGAVACVDEKTAVQGLDRLDPVLPPSPGRAERHGFEYQRHGTLSLYAAFAEQPRIRLHFTPTYASWLNQVEVWCTKIERDLIARGVFRPVPDLAPNLLRYIRHYNKDPRPVKWKYADPPHWITTDSPVRGH